MVLAIRCCDLSGGLRSKIVLDGVITVVDGKNILRQLAQVKPAGAVNEAVQQIAFADRVLLNKVDLLKPEEIAAVRTHGNACLK